jgi:hypothetical protein
MHRDREIIRRILRLKKNWISVRHCYTIRTTCLRKSVVRAKAVQRSRLSRRVIDFGKAREWGKSWTNAVLTWSPKYAKLPQTAPLKMSDGNHRRLRHLKNAMETLLCLHFLCTSFNHVIKRINAPSRTVLKSLRQPGQCWSWCNHGVKFQMMNYVTREPFVNGKETVSKRPQ